MGSRSDPVRDRSPGRSASPSLTGSLREPIPRGGPWLLANFGVIVVFDHNQNASLEQGLNLDQQAGCEHEGADGVCFGVLPLGHLVEGQVTVEPVGPFPPARDHRSN